MRSSTFFFAGLAAVAHAAIDPSVLAKLPTCAQQPLIQGITSSGCNIADQDCICGNKSLISSLTDALKGACSPEDQAKTLEVTSAICPSTGSGAASSAASVATSAESAASSLTSMAGDAASSASAAITTDSGSPATAASDLPLGTGTSTLNYTATTGDYTAPSTPTVTPEQTGGAAQSFGLGFAAMGIGALGLFFAGL